MTAGQHTTTALAERVRAAAAAHQGERGALLPILHAVQADFGCIPAEAVPVLAEELNLSRADVHGVVTFYRDFRSVPAGRTVVQICRAEACQAVGAHALVDAAVERFGVQLGQTTPDGEVTLDSVFCLGNCALGPSATVAGRLYGRVSADALVALVEGRRP